MLILSKREHFFAKKMKNAAQQKPSARYAHRRVDRTMSTVYY